MDNPLGKAVYCMHMNPTAAKIKNGTITLPKEVDNVWRDRDIMVFADGGRRLIIEPASESEWDVYEEKLKKAKLDISPELIDEAVAWARKNA